MPVRRPALVLSILVTLYLAGCAAPNRSEDARSLANEEAYIDMKRSFSLVLPSDWIRVRIPVSSPRYRADSVSWQLPGTQASDNSLQISRQHLSPNESILAGFLSTQPELNESATLSFEHPAGKALRLDGRDALKKVIYTVIQGNEKSYLLAFRVEEKDYTRLAQAINRVILSFSNLQ